MVPMFELYRKHLYLLIIQVTALSINVPLSGFPIASFVFGNSSVRRCKFEAAFRPTFGDVQRPS